MIDKSYSNSFTISAGLHFGLLLIMFWSPSSKQAVLEANERVTAEQMAAPAPIQAVSVDAQEVEKVMHKLQAQKEQAVAREIQRQKTLAAQAEQAKRAKLAEMKQLQQLKQQAENIKRQQEKMQQESKKLAAQQEKKLAALKAKQLAEEQHLMQLKKAKEMELAKANAAKEAQARADAQAAQQRMAGEVDRYKALILNAIRDQWILPESVDPSLSSQFVIRLAPTGSVLEVYLSRSSGDTLLDRSAQAAIYKASPLPVPHDPNTFNMFREITLTVRPSNSRG